jgi:hypothetical protein
MAAAVVACSNSHSLRGPPFQIASDPEGRILAAQYETFLKVGSRKIEIQSDDLTSDIFPLLVDDAGFIFVPKLDYESPKFAMIRVNTISGKTDTVYLATTGPGDEYYYSSPSSDGCIVIRGKYKAYIINSFTLDVLQVASNSPSPGFTKFACSRSKGGALSSVEFDVTSKSLLWRKCELGRLSNSCTDGAIPLPLDVIDQEGLSVSDVLPLSGGYVIAVAGALWWLGDDLQTLTLINWNRLAKNNYSWYSQWVPPNSRIVALALYSERCAETRSETMVLDLQARRYEIFCWGWEEARSFYGLGVAHGEVVAFTEDLAPVSVRARSIMSGRY